MFGYYCCLHFNNYQTIWYILFYFYNLVYSSKYKTPFKEKLINYLYFDASSLIFISSFLIIFYKHAHNYAGNLEYLINLTKNSSFSLKSIFFKKGFGIKLDYKHSNTYYNTCAIHLLDIKSPKNIVKLESLTLLAYLIGTIVWLLAFSYDYRNSVWIQMFGITFLSIYISKLLTYKRNTKIYQPNKSKPNLSLTSPIIKATIISLTVIFISLTCNTKLYNFQKNSS